MKTDDERNGGPRIRSGKTRKGGVNPPPATPRPRPVPQAQKSPQPNCQACKWAKEGSMFTWCMAQGGQVAFQVYNTEACRAVYERK